MTARRIGWFFLGLFLLVASAGGVMYWAARQVPEFYEEVLKEDPLPEERREEARNFIRQTDVLAERVKSNEEWQIDFTDRQINGWLAEELPKRFSDLMPSGVTQPRVKADEGVLLLGFRYEGEGFDGVVSFRLRPRIVAANEIEIEVESFRAGLLPMPIETIVQEIVKRISQEDWQIERVARDGREFVVVRYVRPRRRDPQLESITLKDGTIHITGKSRKGEENSAKTSAPLPSESTPPARKIDRLTVPDDAATRGPAEVRDPTQIE